MSLRHHEIAEADLRILNPYTDDKLMLLGQVSRVDHDTRILDLACGKGEMLCRWADRYGSHGHGVDISEVFLAAAHARAEELRVRDRVTFDHADAATYQAEPGHYSMVSCIGATWIGNGLAGTIELMRRAVAPGGLLLVGEPYWNHEPPENAPDIVPGDFTTLPGTLDRFNSAGVDLVEMVLTNPDSWDRYEASQWWTIERWLHTSPDDDEAPAMRTFLDTHRRIYLTHRRHQLGWGVFVLRTPT
ncbi:MAG TPA: class I SAM-dependent methyltransferase [Mycobacteriales bacterium]|nr:class I SAM-dependent methyltransferase [Mycobacteriales bacterium]